ncbi:MAG: GvpL/GvpF family gas vesicle protein [Jatrophihabitans sp.]|uniref:GvpL/GvpF family gas vesicle protein n=1 Tax=Jatrophihabitans sp. TaxID=1932789 RepID=UPI0039164E32
MASPTDTARNIHFAGYLENLPWLERTARHHDGVVRAASRRTSTIPLRLATICADDPAAARRLVELGERAAAAPDELEGRDEWGVKLFASKSVKPSTCAPRPCGTQRCRLPATAPGATRAPHGPDRSGGAGRRRRVPGVGAVGGGRCGHTGTVHRITA